MKHRILYFLLAVLAIGITGGCTDGFGDINTNPNQASETNPEHLFNTAVWRTLSSTCGSFKKSALDNYVQYNYGSNGQYGTYGEFNTETSSYFRNFYNYCLYPVHLIGKNIAEDNEIFHNRRLIAGIWEAYIYSQVTAIWGPVPMSEALKGTISVPYDDEPAIYASLFETLSHAAASIDPEGDGFAHDPVFALGSGKSDLIKWVKFANSLRLRLAVRICHADPDLAREQIALLMADESRLMTSNEDNCIVHWGDNETARNYLYDYFIVQTDHADKANAAGEGFLMHTAPYRDPRLGRFFTECHSPQMPEDFHWAPWWGMPKTDRTPVNGLLDDNHNPHSGTPATAYSVMQDEYFDMQYGQCLLSFAEVQLLKAELVYLGLGIGSKSDAQYYEEGIRASMEQFGVTDADAVNRYLETDGIEWGTASDLTMEEGEAYYMDYLKLSSGAIKDTDDDMIYHQIIMQQYVALFNQAIDAWTLIRRSQVLDLPPHYKAAYGYRAVNAGSDDVQFAYIPQRLVYPASEMQDNEVELKKAIGAYLPAGDNFDTPLWWARPQLINRRLQQLADNYHK